MIKLSIENKRALLTVLSRGECIYSDISFIFNIPSTHVFKSPDVAKAELDKQIAELEQLAIDDPEGFDRSYTPITIVKVTPAIRKAIIAGLKSGEVDPDKWREWAPDKEGEFLSPRKALELFVDFRKDY